MRYPRLALPTCDRQIADAHLPVQQGHQEPEPAGVGEQAEGCPQLLDHARVWQTGSDRGHPLGVVPMLVAVSIMTGGQTGQT